MIAPLNIGIAGQVAADGTFSFTQPRIAVAQPAVVLATVQTIGSPAWTLTIAGRPASFAPGNSVDLGPRLVAPNESVTISFTGGVPNAQVTGQIHGARGDSVDEVIQYGGLLSANMVSLNSLINRQKLYPDGTPPAQQGLKFPSFSCPVATPITGTFTLPPNTTNVRISILTSPPGSSFSTRFQVVGHANQIPYSPSVAVNAGVPVSTINGFRPIDIRVEPSAEPQVDITVNGDNSNILSVFVSAMYGAETTSIAGITSENGIPVTFNVSGVTPATWQSPNNGNGNGTGIIAPGANLNLIPAPGGSVVTRILIIYMNIIGAAGSFCDLQDTAGGAMGWRIDTTQSTAGPVAIPFYGRALGAGLGLQLHNSSANPTGAINFGVQYSQ